ncbi:MAG: hypothetical protein MR004_01600 [Clostridiales bacterium]|nr:hypothetical protein [Clostridiales bacterium]MDY4037646.1 hypothetical protein [Candidatus Pseudoscilispira sp.]
MAAISTACGDLRERVEILICEQNAAGTEMAWRAERSVWANVQPSTARTIFSTAGLSAPGVEILLRCQPLERTQAIRWHSQHVFITDINQRDLSHILVTGAIVPISQCVADVHTGFAGLKFPAILTEKYLKHEQLEPYAVNIVTYVLVTPPAVELQRGGLVRVDGTAYEVQLAHVLDSTKREYEIVRREDL